MGETMKKFAKSVIGKVLVALSTNPVGRASINQSGYSMVPAYSLEMVKNADKHEDVSKYPVFGELASQTISDGRSCLGYDRLYTIFQSIQRIKASSANTAEVGAYRGGTSKFIAQLEKLKLDTAFQHYVFDTFEGHDAKDIKDIDTHKAQQFNDTSFDSVKELLEPFKFVSVYKGRFEDTCGLIEKKQFEFVHLDMDLYAPTIHALCFFSERMKTGGVIVVDDYGHKSCPGIRKSVDEFLSVDKSFFSFHLLTGQMLVVKL